MFGKIAEMSDFDTTIDFDQDVANSVKKKGEKWQIWKSKFPEFSIQFAFDANLTRAAESNAVQFEWCL